MRKLLSITVGLLCSIAAFGQVNFQELKILDACEQAKQQNKKVCVVLYSSWFQASMTMFDKVFTDPELGDWMNDRFICLKYDYESGGKSDVLRLLVEYGMEFDQMPVSYIFNSDNELETRVLGGTDDPKTWKKMVTRALKISLPAYARQFADGNRDVAFLSGYLACLQQLELYKQPTLEVARALFQHLTDKQKTSPRYWHLFADGTLSPAGSDYLNYVLSRFDAFCKGVGTKKVKATLVAAYKTALTTVFNPQLVMLGEKRLTLDDVREMARQLKPYNLGSKELDVFLLLAEGLLQRDWESVLTVAEENFPTMEEDAVAQSFLSLAMAYGAGTDAQKARVLQLRDKLKATAKTPALRSMVERYNPELTPQQPRD